MRRLVERIVIAGFALLAPAPGSAQIPSLGPLSAEEGAPLHRLSYTPMVEGADLISHGAVRVDLWTSYSNIFEQDSAEAATLYLDMERMIATASVRYGLAPRLEVGGRLTLETDWGGSWTASSQGSTKHSPWAIETDATSPRARTVRPWKTAKAGSSWTFPDAPSTWWTSGPSRSGERCGPPMAAVP